MADLYAGDEDNFPEEVTLPDDSDPPKASIVNPALEGALDRTAFLKERLGALPPLNFGPKIENTGAMHAKYNPVTRQWLGVKTDVNDKFYATSDPLTWSGSSVITGGGQASLKTWDFAIDGAGRCIITAKEFDCIWEWDGSGFITSYASGNIGDDLWLPAIAIDANNVWCLAGPLGAPSNLIIYLSTDPLTTWTPASTPPTGWPDNSALTPVTIGVGGVDGDTMVMRATRGTNLYTSKSTDGGDTWTAAVVTALGFTADHGASDNRQPAPVWTGKRWIIVVPDVTNGTTAVYTSTNGTTWGLKASLSSVAISFVAAIDDALICGASLGGDLVFSVDRGVTWMRGDRAFGTGIVGLAASKSRFVLSQSTSGHLYVSSALGPGVEVVT